jgi:hypothetical protein
MSARTSEVQKVAPPVRSVVARSGEERDAAHQEVLEIEAYLAAVRGELDDLWCAARDATEPGGGHFTTESNRRVADDAAFQALQCLRALESHLLNLGRLL